MVKILIDCVIVYCYFLNNIKVEKIIVYDNIWDR